MSLIPSAPCLDPSHTGDPGVPTPSQASLYRGPRFPGHTPLRANPICARTKGEVTCSPRFPQAPNTPPEDPRPLSCGRPVPPPGGARQFPFVRRIVGGFFLFCFFFFLTFGECSLRSLPFPVHLNTNFILSHFFILFLRREVLLCCGNRVRKGTSLIQHLLSFYWVANLGQDAQIQQ